MKKYLLLIVLSVVVLLVCLCGCESYHQDKISGGDSSAKVSGNGGLVVKQGDYVYFVNGLAVPSENDEQLNYFGNVNLGAIYRARYDAATKKYSDAVCVVPKMFYNTYVGYNGGMYIFGDWIYYTSPSKLADKEGVVQIGDTEFLRTKIDGTGTQSICVIEDNTAVQYRFTKDALVYSLDGNIYSVDLNQKSFKKSNGSVKTLASEVTSFLFPEYDESAYGAVTMADKLAQYVYYTKAVDDDINTHNLLMAVTADGSVTKDLSENLTFKKDTMSTSIADTYTFSLIGSSNEADGLAIYYTKSKYVGSSVSVIGTYGLKLTSTDFADKNDVLFTTSTRTSAATFLGFDKGIMEAVNSIYTVFGQSYAVEPIEDLAYDKLVAVRNENGKDYIYFYKSSLLYRYPLAEDENMVKISTSKAKTDWILGDFIGDDFFFLNADASNYLFRIDLSTYDKNDVDGENLTFNLFGIMTADAYKAYTDAIDAATDEASKVEYSFEFQQ